MKITVLGCGSSLGVPALYYGWGNCDKNNPKNRRTRSSIIIEKENTVLLVDMSPDLRQQILDYGSEKIDAVFFTHVHYDHINGINELRPLSLGAQKTLDIYSRKDILDNIQRLFPYLFEQNRPKIYRTYMKLHEVENEFIIGDIAGTCFEQNHGFSTSLGLRIGNFAYSTDIVTMSEENFKQLQGIDTWIVDCLSLDSDRPTHPNLKIVLTWVDRLQPRMTYLTHMDASMDYDTLLKILPENVRPVYDQMTITVD